MHHLLLDFVSVSLMEIEMSAKVNLEIEELKELPLFLNYLLLSDSTMCDFLRDYLGV